MSTDLENPILRQYPSHKYITETRFDEHAFEKYRNISRENFEKWKSGINYKTNRKIKIGGKTHRDLGYNFHIRPCCSSYSGILFTELDNIDPESYHKETTKLRQEIDNYNSTIGKIITEINSLKQWDDYILFDGKKYGIPPIYNGIHREHNCLGVIEKDYYEDCRCHLCEDWNGCGSGGTTYYKCLRCDYKYGENGRCGFNHKGK